MMEPSASVPTTPTADNGNNNNTQQLSTLNEKQKREQEIYNNFATPLIGTYLNLPEDSVMLKCPACGIVEMTEVEDDLRWWASEINKFIGCLWVTFCCCFCFDYSTVCSKTDRNHYCKNCGCYFGRAMKHSAIKPKTLNK